ncbi:MAG TPA: cytochrome c [Candidatus Acidoferrales bacterium]|nr:cytochrome c [Candidatus Acidoferrales bacterium]
MSNAKGFHPTANFFFALALFGTSGCSRAGSPDRVQAISHGEALYQMNCKACHEGKNLELVKQPPQLAGLFQRSRLPSGAPATDEVVGKTIMEGRGIMPPFQQSLTAEDIDDLIRYLHTLGPKERPPSNSQAGHEVSPRRLVGEEPR